MQGGLLVGAIGHDEWIAHGGEVLGCGGVYGVDGLDRNIACAPDADAVGDVVDIAIVGRLAEALESEAERIALVPVVLPLNGLAGKAGLRGADDAPCSRIDGVCKVDGCGVEQAGGELEGLRLRETTGEHDLGQRLGDVGVDDGILRGARREPGEARLRFDEESRSGALCLRERIANYPIRSFGGAVGAEPSNSDRQRGLRGRRGADDEGLAEALALCGGEQVAVDDGVGEVVVAQGGRCPLDPGDEGGERAADGVDLVAEERGFGGDKVDDLADALARQVGLNEQWQPIGKIESLTKDVHAHCAAW